MNKLKVGWIGAGGIGRHLAASAKPVEEIEIAGFADVDRAAAEKAANDFGAALYDDWQSLLKEESIQAVVIATPPFAHLDQVMGALEAGKHVFCEKPLALSVADCETMIQAADQANKTFMVGQVLRLFPLFYKSKEILDSGVLGKPQSLFIRRAGLAIELFSQGWRAKRELGGGLILETNVHELDYARWIAGEVQQVCVLGRHDSRLGDYEGFWQGLFWFDSGVTGAIESSLIDPLGEYSVRIQCEKGSLTHGGFGGTLRWKTYDGQEGAVESKEVGTPDPYTWELRAFARHGMFGEPMPFDARDGRQAVALGCACVESLDQGGAMVKVK